MLKVIQIIDSLNVGGAEVLAINIANALADQDVESHLCVTRKEGGLKKNIQSNVGYLFLEKKSTFHIMSLITLWNYIKTNDIAIMHAHSSSFFSASCIKLMYPKIKIVWHDHYGNSEFLESRKNKALTYASYLFSTIISVNVRLKEWAIHNLHTSKVYFLQNFPALTNRDRKTVLKGTSGKRIVCLAGYRPQKDHLNLLEAFASCVQENPEWTLHLIGKNYKDAYGNSISSFIRNHNLEHSVFEYDVCSDIQHILEQVEIGVLSSKSEGLPISLLEYGLANIAVLVTDVGECAQVVQHNNGIVASEDSVVFANKLSCLMSNDALREEVAKDVHHRVLQEYSEEKVVKTIISIYKELC